MQGDVDTGRYLRWGAVPKLWPRRLLHIPTMTSLQRQDGNVYGCDKEPAYSILTYTWGRWEVEDGPRLGVSGTSWKIPAVDETHFSVGAFQRVINLMGEKTTYAWVDIACIDQENDAIKMDEIGRQVGIFANAQGVYLWLSRLPTTSLQSSWTEIVVCNREVWKAVRKNPGVEMFAILQRLNNATTTLLGDPWFSSLWTLQEGILRRDAMFLSRDSEPIMEEYSESRSTVYLHFLSTTLHELRLYLMDPSYNFDEQPQLRQLTDNIIARIERAGYTTDAFSRNPNVQYSAAKHRQTRNELDRIYGIMSIYGVRVGEAAGDFSAPYTFDRLEDEFAGAINAVSPAIGQLFIHLNRPKENRTWRITQNIRVPEELSTVHGIESDPFCKISATPHGQADFQGKICPLSDLFEFSLSLVNSQNRSETKIYRYPTDIDFGILTDDYLSGEYPMLREPVLESYLYLASIRVKRAHRVVPALLSAVGKENLSLLLLGQEKDEHPMLKTFGLILLHDSLERRRTRRLGVCMWYSGRHMEALAEQSTAELRWQDFDGQIF